MVKLPGDQKYTRIRTSSDRSTVIVGFEDDRVCAHCSKPLARTKSGPAAGQIVAAAIVDRGETKIVHVLCVGYAQMESSGPTAYVLPPPSDRAARERVKAFDRYESAVFMARHLFGNGRGDELVEEAHRQGLETVAETTEALLRLIRLESLQGEPS